MAGPIPHHSATGIHPGAFVRDTAPDTTDVQDGVLWLDTSAGPPHQLKRWDAGAATWHTVQMDATGYPLPAGHRIDSAIHDPLEQAVDYTNLITLPASEAERVLPGADVRLDGYQGSIHVFWVADLNMTPQGVPQNWTLRIRRTNLAGEVLRTGVINNPSGSTFNPVEFAGSFIDTTPTDGHYVISIENTGAPGLTIESTRRYLRLLEVETGERLRLVHATAGLQVEMPFATATAPPSSFLGRDPASGLPAWASLPAITGLEAIPAAPATADTCVQVRCGVAVALRDKLIGDYEFWRHIINAAASTFLGLTITALLGEILAVLVAMEVAAWILTVFRIVSPVLKIATPLALPSLVPAISPDQADYLLQVFFCQLSCEGDTVGVSATAMQAVASVILSNTTTWSSDVQRMLLGEVAYYHPVAEWQAAATNATASTLCDGMTCG